MLRAAGVGVLVREEQGPARGGAVGCERVDITPGARVEGEVVEAGAAAVVLGLPTTKSPRLEYDDDVLARIAEAARYKPLDELALSTQCGFSPVSIGANLISEDTQQRKLELVAEVAHQASSNPSADRR